MAVYRVRLGDTIAGIVQAKCGATPENLSELVRKVVDANKARYPQLEMNALTLFAGWELEIPCIEETGPFACKPDYTREGLEHKLMIETLRDTNGDVIEGANLAGVLLCGLNLSGVIMPRVRLTQANLDDADLSRAILRHATLEGSSMKNARLCGADLRSINLLHAIVDGTHIGLGTLFDGAILPDGSLYAQGVNLTAYGFVISCSDSAIDDTGEMEAVHPPQPAANGQ